jgi:hypothetical protein
MLVVVTNLTRQKLFGLVHIGQRWLVGGIRAGRKEAESRCVTTGDEAF